MLKSRIPQIALALPVVMDGVAERGAELVEARAKPRAPDRPPIGEGLVEAIHTERREAGVHAVVAGDGDHWYGRLLEHGTTHSAPHPFLIPAFEESTEEIVALGRAALGAL